MKTGSAQDGLKLFPENCGSCHTLAAAQTSGTIGPNLDASFAQARADGFKESSIRDIVAGQIRDPGQYATGSGSARLTANMPADLVTGKDAVDVATYVAENAGKQGFASAQVVTGTNGKAIFVSKCGGCHTLKAAGTTGTQGPNLDVLKPALDRAKRQVINGGGIMPAFKDILSAAQIDAVARYVAEHTP